MSSDKWCTTVDGKEINLIITDLNMPNLDGVGLIKNVRALPGNRFVPIIMLTSESNPEMKKDGRDAGASGWVTKPFKPESLLSVIKMICPS